MSRPRTLLLAVALSAVALLGGCGSGEAGSAPGTSPTSSAGAATTATSVAPEPVVKDVLGSDVDPPGAPGSTLTLIRYTIAPGAELAPHIHPGVQMAHIDAGTLTYTIESGTARLRRAGAAEAAPVTGPTTLTLEPGDTIIEPDGMVHFGANRGDVPVLITATLLTRTDAGLSETVPTPDAAVATTAPTP